MMYIFDFITLAEDEIINILASEDNNKTSTSQKRWQDDDEMLLCLQLVISMKST